MKTKIFVCLVLAFVGCSSDEKSLNDEVIIPGMGITSISFGDSAKNIFDAFGSVTPRTLSINGDGFRYFLDYPAGVTFIIEEGTTEELDESLKVFAMTFESPFEGATSEGIGIGSTKSELEAAFGEPDSDLGGSTYFDLGMNVSFVDDVIDYIQIEE